MEMEDVITVNGMKFEKTRLLPNFQGIYDSDPCLECHLDIDWVDYGGERLCGKIDCANRNRNSHYVWTIVGGTDKLKSK